MNLRPFIRTRDLIVLGVMGLALWPAMAPSECVDYQDFMHWEGSLELPATGLDILIAGPAAERAYVATETGVAAISLVDPSTPALIDTLDLWQIDRERTPMALFGNQLWVAARERGLCLIQTEPMAVTAWITTPGEPRDVAVRGGFALVADWDEGLQIYDAQTSPPILLGGIDLPGFASGVAVDGDRAYVADLLGLTVVDIGVPSSPQRLGSLTLPGTSRDLVVRDDLAYVIGTAGIHTVDVSDPMHPERIDTLSEFAVQFTIHDEHLILSNPDRLIFMSLADPRHPALIGRLDQGQSWGLATHGDRLYVSGHVLSVLNHEGFALPPVIGRIDDPPYGFQEAAVDGDLVCGLSYATVSFLGVGDPAHPVLLSQMEERDTRSVTIGGGFAYLVQSEACVILDLATPEAPVPAARVESLGDPVDGLFVEDRLYVLSLSEGLQVMDVSQPAEPIVRSVYDPAGGNYAFRVQGSHVYLGGYDLKGMARLLVVDAADPAALHAIGSYEFSGEGSVRTLAVDGTRAYVIVTRGFYSSVDQLATIDLDDPAHPILVGLVNVRSLPAPGIGLEAHGGLVYLWGEGGFLVLDMSDANSPVIVASRLAEDLYSLLVTDDWIGVTNGSSFLTLPLQCQTPAPVELASFAAEPQPGAIRLTWQTAREWDHLGFHLERAPAASGVFERLTRTLIEPPGPYAFLDREVEPGTTYYYRLEALNRRGGSERHGPWPATALPGSGPTAAPLADHLAACHPNPFAAGAPSTEIAFSVAQSGPVRLRLIDATGRVVATLLDRALPAGRHQATWDGRTARGEMAAAGIYFYRLEAGDFTATRQLVRLR